MRAHIIDQYRALQAELSALRSEMTPAEIEEAEKARPVAQIDKPAAPKKA